MSILILGYGKTGKAVCDYIASAKKFGGGEPILIYDDNIANINDIEGCSGSTDKKVLFFNRDNEEILIDKYFKNIKQCIASPGIERTHTIILKLKSHNIPVFSEIEFAYRELKNNSGNYKIIGITGTNGKTTTTTLVKSAIDKAGLSNKTFVGGNLGIPFISGIMNYENFALEISSFQLEWIYDFKPNIGVLLNVKDDHLDRYKNFDEYRLTKYKLFKNFKYDDVAILNGDDYNSSILKGIIGSNVVLYGFNETDKCDVYYKEGAIHLMLERFCGFNASISLKNIKDNRKFVISDMMAAACSLILYGISPEVIESAFEEYSLLKHRVEYIGNIGNIAFYDDSKATNPAAVISALESFKGEDKNNKNRDIVLILGGKDKGFNYECIVQPIKNRVKACVIMGETKDILKETLRGHIELITATDMDDAVKKSFAFLTERKDIISEGAILLSPASSSFDMFKDYNERGDVFKKCYIELKNRLCR